MGQCIKGAVRTFQSGAAIGKYLRVKLTAGKLAVAGLADIELGTIEAETFAADEWVGVYLANAQGTVLMEAAAAISLGAVAYTAANGQVSATATSAKKVGIALEAATAGGDIIEVQREARV